MRRRRKLPLRLSKKNTTLKNPKKRDTCPPVYRVPPARPASPPRLDRSCSGPAHRARSRDRPRAAGRAERSPQVRPQRGMQARPSSSSCSTHLRIAAGPRPAGRDAPTISSRRAWRRWRGPRVGRPNGDPPSYVEIHLAGRIRRPASCGSRAACERRRRSAGAPRARAKHAPAATAPSTSPVR